MKIKLITLATAGILLSSPVLAQEPTPSAVDPTMPAQVQAQVQEQALPVRLTTSELDRVTAGDLGLPNGKVMFTAFDNAAPGDFHPNFNRSPTAIDASGNNEGPWNAAFNSPVIEFQCSICP